MTDSEYRQAEILLRRYPGAMARLNIWLNRYNDMKASLDIMAQGYGTLRSPGGEISDPVSRRVEVIEHAQSIIRSLMRQTVPVNEVRCELKNADSEEAREMWLIMERYYFEHERLEWLSRDIGVSVRTLSRRKSELLRLVAISEREYCERVEKNGRKYTNL